MVENSRNSTKIHKQSRTGRTDRQREKERETERHTQVRLGGPPLLRISPQASAPFPNKEPAVHSKSTVAVSSELLAGHDRRGVSPSRAGQIVIQLIAQRFFLREGARETP